MKLKYTFLIKFAFSITFIFTVSDSYSQDAKKGHAYGDVFLNYNYNLENNQSSFRLNRLHFGYRYDYSENFFFNGMIESALEDYVPDTQSTGGEYNHITNLFEFCLGFHFEKIQGKIGLIGTELNQVQEKLWRHRHIDKVFADKYGYAPTNDFGFIIKYNPTSFFQVDFSVTNGEGHKSLQRDSTYRYAIGGTLSSSSGFTCRLYSDFINYSDHLQSNLVGILGFQNSTISSGIEYNIQKNYTGLENFNRSGLSIYFSANLTKKNILFGRYDKSTIDTPASTSPFAAINNSQLIIFGLQRNLINNVNMSLDYRSMLPEHNNQNNNLIFCCLEILF